jgi:hypothetical protein
MAVPGRQPDMDMPLNQQIAMQLAQAADLLEQQGTKQEQPAD